MAVGDVDKVWRWIGEDTLDAKTRALVEERFKRTKVPPKAGLAPAATMAPTVAAKTTMMTAAATRVSAVPGKRYASLVV